MELNLKALAAEYGPKNLRVIMSAQRLSYQGLIPGIALINSVDPEVPNIEFALDESMYKVEQGYKMKLVPAVEAQRLIYGSRTFYISDFESIVNRCGDIRVMLLTIDGYSTLFHNREKANV